MLDTYKFNMVEYKVSGNAANKSAATTVKKWLDEYVKAAQEGAEKGANEIQNFVSTYAKSDAELARIKRDLEAVRKDGPELQTIYETEREAQKTQPVDYTIYYTKGAVVAGIAALVAVANMF